MIARERILSRRVLLLFLAVVGFTVGQFTWWVIFNIGHARKRQQTLQTQIERDRALAGELIALRTRISGAGDTDAQALLRRYFPHLAWAGGTAADVPDRVVIRPEVHEKVVATYVSQVRMFLWEGGFFLLVLLSGVALIWRTMHQEVHLRLQQRNFLSAVTHELKSPLASIRLYTQTIQLRDPPLPKRLHYLSNIRQDVDRLETLVGNLLAVARLDARDMHLKPTAGDLGNDVAKLIAQIRPQIEERGVSLSSDICSDEAITACYDADVLRTVLNNLLDNAIKYGGAQKKIDVSLHGDERWVALRVADHGIGLAATEQERIFGKFYRVGDEMVRGTEGSGLGLYLVRELMRQQGGDVVAHSPGLGQGSTFVVSWPRVPGSHVQKSDVRKPNMRKSSVRKSSVQGETA